MPPKESTALLSTTTDEIPAQPKEDVVVAAWSTQFSMDNAAATAGRFDDDENDGCCCSRPWCLALGCLGGCIIAGALLLLGGSFIVGGVVPPTTTDRSSPSSAASSYPTGPYRLVERQRGEAFFDFYDFYDGPDSLGSAGYNVYVGEKRAKALDLVNATTTSGNYGDEFVFMRSAAPGNGQGGGPRASVRLEGKRRFDSGLFVLDLAHMPAGCGVWPAFWLTDEDNWPDNGEIDVVEGINTQRSAKTALHTSFKCSMYAHVPSYAHTGRWDVATGIPDTFTGIRATDISVPADNCWTMAPHQWANQGCVMEDSRNNTIGEPLNKAGGGIYVLEWDPAAGYIKSWVFTAGDEVPANLHETIRSAAALQQDSADASVVPEPNEWGVLPYAYFAIGDGSGCSADHFENMHLIFNLAFCGTVAGNRFGTDCPALARQFNGSNPVEQCNAYIESQPDALEEAYWKIRGVYVYQRE